MKKKKQSLLRGEKPRFSWRELLTMGVVSKIFGFDGRGVNPNELVEKVKSEKEMAERMNGES